MAALSAACTSTRPARGARAGPTPASAVPTTTGTGPATTLTTAPDPCLRDPQTCSLRAVGAARGVLIGTSVVPGPLRDLAAYRSVIEREFASVTPETQAKWAAVEPTRGQRDYAALDALVAFAGDHHLRVRGHTLLWDPTDGNATPRWVRSLRDPGALQAAVTEHIHHEVRRYAGRIDRWDVVNEPFAPHGATLAPNQFERVLGPGYIDAAFRAAHDADPTAKLWLNENVFEHLAKADAVVALVRHLRDAGVPLEGVGLQAHFLSGRAPAPGVVEGVVTRLRRLGVAVAITELDIPRTGSGGLDAQARAYQQVVAECVRGGCDEITVWGVDDRVSWLDHFLHRQAAPLLFDRSDRPKPAYLASKRALATTAAEG